MAGKMKIRTGDYECLKEAIGSVIKLKPNMAKNYKKKGLSKKRYIWDLFSMADCWELYNYLNDSHINTALNKIVSNY